MMFWRSHTRPRWFMLRTRWGLLWCHGCGVRYNDAYGVLTSVDDRYIQWACGPCYLAAYRRAQS